jgi:hypothetical protein
MTKDPLNEHDALLRLDPRALGRRLVEVCRMCDEMLQIHLAEAMGEQGRLKVTGALCDMAVAIANGRRRADGALDTTGYVEVYKREGLGDRNEEA